MSGIQNDVVRRALRDPQRALDELTRARCRRSLYEYTQVIWPVIEPATPFIHGRAMRVLCEHLEAVARRQIKRLIVNVPPGFSKSTITAVAFPTWVWGPMEQPGEREISWSYAEALAIRDNVKCRRVVRSEMYQRLWPHVSLVDDQDEKSYFETGMRGFRQACGIGGGTTGYRGGILIVDDPHNVKDGESQARRDAAVLWAKETLPSRGNNEDAAFVVIMQRVHANDVAGAYMEDPSWERLILPMEYEPDHPNPSRTSLGFVDWRTEPGELLWPERFPEHMVEQLKKTLGDYAYAGQYQQRPAPREGGMFKRDKLIVSTERAPATARRVRGWDLAGSTGKYSAYTTGVLLADHGGRTYVEDVVRVRKHAGEVQAFVVSVAEEDAQRYGEGAVKQSIPQDPGQAGKSQKVSMSRALAGHSFVFSPETGDKETRAQPLASQVEAGNVVLPAGAPWLRAFLDEVSYFPNGKYKDQVDGASRAYSALLSRRRRPVGSAARVTVGEPTVGASTLDEGRESAQDVSS